MSSNGSGIMDSRKAAAFLDAFRKSLAARLISETPEDSRILLESLRNSLAGEAAAGRACLAASEKLIADLAAATTAAELAAIKLLFRKQLAAQFALRQSVRTIYDLAAAFHDQLFSAALGLAMKASGRWNALTAATPPALLVSGGLGRKEATNATDSCLLLIHADGDNDTAVACREVAEKLNDILDGVTASGSATRDSGRIWTGSLSAWEQTAQTALLAEPGNQGDKADFSRMVALLADAREVCGDSALTREVIDRQRRLLAATVGGRQFCQLAGEITAMPVALGLFGRFKTVRNGANKGKFPITKLAITPLRDSVRILAIAGNAAETSTSERLRSIMSASLIGVTLAENIAAAFTCFCFEKIRLELSRDAEGEQFLDPVDLEDERNEELRTGLEYVTTLQRLTYQQLVEAERR